MRIAFDVLGSREKAVAIIDGNISSKQVAKEIMEKHKNIKSVLAKVSERQGEFRLYKFKLIAGEKNTEVIHKENGYLLKFDPRKTYFSTREAEERRRVTEKIKNNEKILLMFSGISPFAVGVMNKFKKSEAKPMITCVELNPEAVKYAEENIKLNKIDPKYIKNICGDVRAVALDEKFDRIIMPLPETAYQFLDTAFKYSKKGTIIHLYGIDKAKAEKNFPFAVSSCCQSADKVQAHEGTNEDNEDGKDLEKKIKEQAKNSKVKYKIIEKRKVSPYSPRKFKFRFDLKVLKV